MNRRDVFKSFIATAAAAGVEVEKVQVVEVPEDAIFVLRYQKPISQSSQAHIQESWKHLGKRYPPLDGIPLIILDDGMSMEVLSAKTNRNQRRP